MRKRLISLTFGLLAALAAAPTAGAEPSEREERARAAGPPTAEKVRLSRQAVEPLAQRVASVAAAKNPKLGSGLAFALSAGGKDRPSKAPPGLITDKDRVLVDIVLGSAEAGDQLVERLSPSGLAVRNRVVPERIEAWLPPALVAPVAADPGVLFVRPARTPVSFAGSVTPVEVANSGADDWHAAGFTGMGVRIGVLDLRWVLFDTAQATGDWPTGAQLEIHDVDGGGLDTDGTDAHGTVMVEVLYDFAPGATFVLYDIETIADSITAANSAVSDDIDILVVTIGAQGEGQAIGDGQACPPYDPPPCGSYSEALQSARNAGVFVVQAAGNSGQSHWIGPYAQDAIDLITHDWAPGQNLLQITDCLPAGEVHTAQLFWDDWINPTSDYDLLVYRLKDGITRQVTQVASSRDPQNGQPGQRPFEFATWTTSGQTTHGCDAGLSNYLYLVERIAGPVQILNFFSPLSVFDPVPQRSLRTPADLAEAYTVSAVDAIGGTQLTSASRGPVLGAGGTLEPPPIGLDKPNASAEGIAEISIVPAAFSGTSVSAAVTAGQAALLLQANPSWTADDLEAGLDALATANPLAAPIQDVGLGLIRVGSDPPLPDSDLDGVPDDGDDSGTIGDNPCPPGVTTGCDDNCTNVPNAALPNAGSFGFGDQADQDADGVGDLCDVCVLAANGPLAPDAGGNSQLDTNGDQFGNLCDGDFDDNGVADLLDLQFIDLLISAMIFDPNADMNGDGVVDTTDRDLVVLDLPPGPSFASAECFNGVDDDGDDHVDLADGQCIGDATLGAEDGTAQVSIPDTGLLTAINAALGQQPGDPVTVNQLQGLTTLEAANAGISDLTGLEGATGLVTVDLRNNDLSDISILEGLPSLQTALLYGNPGLGDPCDLNGDALIDVADGVRAVRLAEAGSVALSDLAVADVAPPSGPGDGSVGAADVLLILRAGAGEAVTVCSSN